MKKIRSRSYQENLVKLAIDVLEKKIDPKFGRNRMLQRLYIHKQPNNKYHKVFLRIVLYLKELRGDYKNELSDMLVDYYTNVYRYFRRYGRAPSINNFSPSSSNRIRFEEFIYELTARSKEEYWIKEIPEPPEVIHIPIIPENNESLPSFIETR